MKDTSEKKWYWYLQCMVCGEIVRYLGYYSDDDFNRTYPEAEELQGGYCPLCQVYGGMELSGSEFEEFAVMRGEIKPTDSVEPKPRNPV